MIQKYKFIIILLSSLLTAVVAVYILHHSLLDLSCSQFGGEYNWTTRFCTDMETYEEYYIDMPKGFLVFYGFIGFMTLFLSSLLISKVLSKYIIKPE